MANADHAGPYTKPVPVPSARKQSQRAADRKGSLEAKARSEGMCEVIEIRYSPVWGDFSPGRCLRMATQVHHLIGGIGKRGIGISALAEHKQHVCDQCHRDITGDIGGKKMIRVGGVIPHYTDRYRRA